MLCSGIDMLRSAALKGRPEKFMPSTKMSWNSGRAANATCSIFLCDEQAQKIRFDRSDMASNRKRASPEQNPKMTGQVRGPLPRDGVGITTRRMLPHRAMRRRRPARIRRPVQIDTPIPHFYTPPSFAEITTKNRLLEAKVRRAFRKDRNHT